MTRSIAPHLQSLMAQFEEWDRGDLLLYFRLVNALGEDTPKVLAETLSRTALPWELRRLVVETAYYYPWETWLTPLGRILRFEQDLDLFDVGIQALGRMRSPRALGVLRELHGAAQLPDFQQALSRELTKGDPKEAFQYHLGRLQVGATNPRIANEAAAELARTMEPWCLAPLVALVGHPDLLIARHAIKLTTLVPSAEAAAFLNDHFMKGHQDILDDRDLAEATNILKGVQPATFRPEVITQVVARFRDRAPAAVAVLQGEGAQDAASAFQATGQLRQVASGRTDGFLLEALDLALEGRHARFSALVGEAVQGLKLRSRQSVHALDTCAEGLAKMADIQLTDRARLVPMLCEAYRLQTGREGTARALGHLVALEDGVALEQLFANQDSALRGAALEAMGARQQAQFLPQLLRACRDPIVDIAQRAILALGRLPGSLEVVQGLLEATHPEEIRLGLRIAAVGRQAGLFPAVREVFSRAEREDLKVDASLALGALGNPEAIAPLLAEFHSGQSLRLQEALARALRDLRHPQAAEALAAKALELKQPALHLLAVEALVTTFRTPGPLLGTAEAAMIRQQLRAGWGQREPWSFRLAGARLLADLEADAPDFYMEMASLLSETLGDKRCMTAWSREEQMALQGIAQGLRRKAEGLRAVG